MLVYTDGSCWPNNGKGSGGWAYAHKNPDWTYTMKFGHIPAPTTNNVAELRAVINAITDHSDAEIQSDSQYVVKGFNQWMKSWIKKGWSKKGGLKNVELWKNLAELKAFFTGKLIWVRGHNGTFLNDLADAGANYARKTKKTSSMKFTKEEADKFIKDWCDNLGCFVIEERIGE